MTRADRDTHLDDQDLKVCTGGNQAAASRTMVRMTPDEWRRLPLQPEEWSKKVARFLEHHHIKTWGQLEGMYLGEILRTRGMGRVTTNEVLAALDARRLDQRPTMPEGFRARHASPIPRTQPPAGRSGVYFVGVGAYVKIGHAADIRRRFAQLATGMPEQPELLAVIPRPDSAAARSLEADLHQRFRKQRARREWFHREPLADVIRSLQAGVEPW